MVWPLPLLLAAQAGAAPAADVTYPIACAYVSVRDLENADGCAARAGAGYVIAPQVARDLSYTAGLAVLALPGGRWFYRRRDGRTAEVLAFDNGPDPFEEGLARSIVNGRIAYVDRRLRVRMSTGYDWGDRFRHGRAAVCIGCVSRRDASGEHGVMTGGRWGVIDRHGRELVPPTLTREEHDRLPASVTGLR